MDDDGAAANLDEIEKAFQNLTLYAGDTSRASTAISVLAEASRSDLSAREKLADPKILQILIEVIECSINDSLETVEVALRCMGNACIDNDVAKAEITKHGFSWARQCLPAVIIDDTGSENPYISADPAIGMLTAKVLYNVCSDYEPAQQRCFDESVHYALIQLYTSGEAAKSQDGALFVELLFWICSHTEPEHVKPSSNVLKSLLTLPDLYNNSLDTEDFALLIETCLLFLREPAVKQDVTEQKLVKSIWTMLAGNESNIRLLRDDDHDGRRVLVPISTGIIWILSDVAATPEFAQKYPLDDVFIQQVVISTINTAIQNGPDVSSPKLVDAACQILGNLLWSNKGLLHYEAIESLHRPLTTILTASQDAELLHSAAGLLVQLSRLSAEFREVLGRDENTQVIVARLGQHEMPQLKQDGIALLKALGKDSPANQERFSDLAKSVLGSISSSDTAMVEG